MKKSQRWTEKWFNIGLWIIAFIFAWFLIQLGQKVVADLPKVESQIFLKDFRDKDALKQLDSRLAEYNDAIAKAEMNAQLAKDDVDRASLVYQSAKEQFKNWIETRQITTDAAGDRELEAHTNELNALQQRELTARQAYRESQQKLTELSDMQQKASLDIANDKAQLEAKAFQEYSRAMQFSELKVFLLRLCVTLPLLVIAGGLFVKKRKSAYWPFVWGFIFFALFAFFVELVPYLPSYGGYIRALAGVILSVVIGVGIVRALRNYINKQKESEMQPEAERRQEISYDKALAQLGQSVCPGCERHVDLTNENVDFCPHCGLCLFDRCEKCNARKSSFSLFCYACGTPVSGENRT